MFQHTYAKGSFNREFRNLIVNNGELDEATSANYLSFFQSICWNLIFIEKPNSKMKPISR